MSNSVPNRVLNSLKKDSTVKLTLIRVTDLLHNEALINAYNQAGELKMHSKFRIQRTSYCHKQRN